MRAYAIVRKPHPGIQEHVVKITKEEPKISIDPIAENLLAEAHKAGSSEAHELENSGAYFRLVGGPEHDSHRSRKSSEKEQPLKEERVRAPLQDHPEEERNFNVDQPRSTRTKKLFQEFLASPIRLKEDESKEPKLGVTPVRLLEPDDHIILPVQSVIEVHPRKPRIFDHSPRLDPEEKDIVYENDSKSINCCGEVSVQSSEPPAPPPMQFKEIPVPQPTSKDRQESSKKRRIFDDFAERDRVVEEFTFKEQRVSNRIPEERPADRSIRVKVFEFVPIPPFDI